MIHNGSNNNRGKDIHTIICEICQIRGGGTTDDFHYRLPIIILKNLTFHNYKASWNMMTLLANMKIIKIQCNIH